MRFAFTEEEKRLYDLVSPYWHVQMKPFGMFLDDDAPEEIKQADKRLDELFKQHREACSDY